MTENGKDNEIGEKARLYFQLLEEQEAEKKHFSYFVHAPFLYVFALNTVAPLSYHFPLSALEVDSTTLLFFKPSRQFL